jgi:hypothetical protein
MWLTSWLRKKQHAPAPRRERTLRPTLEALEDRWVPSALTLTVNSLGDSGTGTGTTGDLRYCINLANQNHNTSSTPDVIDASGVSGTDTLQQGGGAYGGAELLISDPNLVINGPGATNLAISGASSGTSRVFEVSAGAQVQLSGMTIENGSGGANFSDTSAWADDGGGILNFGTLTVTGCAISGNIAYSSHSTVYGYGGGIYNAGTLTVSNSSMENNTAVYGGGIYNGGGPVTVSNNSIVNLNTAAFGGGIYNTGTLTVSNSTLDRNTVGGQGSFSGDGGAIYNGQGATLTVSNSTLERNTAYPDVYPHDGAEGRGGAIYNDGLATLSGSIVSVNRGVFGGGIYIGKQANLTIESQSSVVNNYYMFSTTSDNLWNDQGHVKISRDSRVGVTSPPQINSITASAASVTAGSPLTLTANITDPTPGSSITEVLFYAPGLVGWGTQTSPGVWTLTFSTAGWAPGTYTFYASAMDNYGVWDGGSPTVTVQVT